MIRLFDASVLAYTKLRVHRIRTGIAVAVAALLFGLIGGAIIVAQGIFTSVNNFSDEGLNNRTVLAVTRSGGGPGFNEYDKRTDANFVKEVEVAHKAIVEKKKAAAKKYAVAYDSTLQDPSPITIDPATKQKVISDNGLSSEAVQQVAQAKRAAEYKPFAITDFTKKYSSAHTIQKTFAVAPAEGNFTYMKDGTEPLFTNERERMEQQYSQDTPHMSILDGSLSKPFVVPGKFDASKGEIPAIIPLTAAEKALGLKALDAKASMGDRLDRLAFVRNNINKATVSFCYRNPASDALLTKALAQANEIKTNANDKNYVKPKLVYSLPSKTDCGEVAIASDTRSASEKKQDENQMLYDKEVGAYLGEPVQKKIIVRGVGVSGDYPDMQAWSLSSLIQSLFGSSLGTDWSVPADLLAQLPAESRPDYLFNVDPNSAAKSGKGFGYTYESYLVEFTDKDQARKALAEGRAGQNQIFAMPFGSSTLFVDEAKTMFTEVLKWALLIIGGIAIIILASIIGRTVAEGRRESAIFRAIGASRGDISAVYGMYVLFLAIQVVIFSAVFACVAAGVVQMLYGADATLGARLAYAASDTTREFYLFNLGSSYLLWIAGAIFAASVIASILPILLGARRNPIKDMRNE